MARNSNKWFKHYNTASQGHSLSLLWASSDTEAIALWWLLLELISRWEDCYARGTVALSYPLLERETGWKRSKCRRVLARISSVAEVAISEINETTFAFTVPNWLELQETRGGKRVSKKEQKPEREEREEREERIIDKEQPQIPSVFGKEDKNDPLIVDPISQDSYSLPPIQTEAHKKANSPPAIPKAIKAEWEDTLRHYGREPNWARDESKMLRLYLQKWLLDWDRISHALTGFRKEVKNQNYDPAMFVNLDRLMHQEKFGKLEALGEAKLSENKNSEPFDSAAAQAQYRAEAIESGQKLMLEYEQE